MSDPKERTAVLATLVEVLLPGDADFPGGGAVGVQAKLAERLIDHAGAAALEQVLDGMAGLGEAADREAVVKTFEAAEPQLFSTVRAICFTAYYESPFVHEAIRSLGFAYNATPLPKGYGLKRFDPETDAPRHGRGYYLPTEAVTRVDLSGLDIKELRHGH
jgi:hypothetical protein